MSSLGRLVVAISTPRSPAPPLTRDQVVDIFIRHYFGRPRINLLPEPLQASVFDMYVNADGNAAKILQRLLPEFGKVVSVDGALGPKTAAAVGRAYEKAGPYLVDAYGIARRNYYFRIADARSASRKYARTRAGGEGGWIIPCAMASSLSSRSSRPS